jgi:hypothetical protein
MELDVDVDVNVDVELNVEAGASTSRMIAAKHSIAMVSTSAFNSRRLAATILAAISLITVMSSATTVTKWVRLKYMPSPVLETVSRVTMEMMIMITFVFIDTTALTFKLSNFSNFAILHLFNLPNFHISNSGTLASMNLLHKRRSQKVLAMSSLYTANQFSEYITNII